MGGMAWQAWHGGIGHMVACAIVRLGFVALAGIECFPGCWSLLLVLDKRKLVITSGCSVQNKTWRLR